MTAGSIFFGMLLILLDSNRSGIKPGALQAAKKIHGGKTHNMLTDFRCTLNEDTLYESKVHVIDAYGDTIARVDAAHLYDPKAASRRVA